LAISPLLIDVADSITLIDALTLAISPLLINVSDIITVLDTLTLVVGAPLIVANFFVGLDGSDFDAGEETITFIVGEDPTFNVP